MHKRTQRGLAAALLGAAVAVGGCGGDEVVRPTVSVSVGQQLIDLKKARDSGAISEGDYRTQKAKLIENVE